MGELGPEKRAELPHDAGPELAHLAHLGRRLPAEAVAGYSSGAILRCQIFGSRNAPGPQDLPAAAFPAGGVEPSRSSDVGLSGVVHTAVGDRHDIVGSGCAA